MFKRSVFTHITPLPSYVPRDVVVDILHSHGEMIELNPLVTSHRRCDPPPALALPDELEAAWYEITDRISYLPGGLLSGSVTYYGCFHDLPRGLQTHVHAPAGLEIRAKWQVCGNMPGEPRAPVELGMEKLRIPKEGLYLREDVDLRCSLVLLGMVKKNLKKSHAGLVERLLERTRHLADARSHDSTSAYLQQSGSDSRPASLYSSHSSSNTGDDRKHGNYTFTRHDSWPGQRPASPDSVRSWYNNNHSQHYRYYSQQYYPQNGYQQQQQQTQYQQNQPYINLEYRHSVEYQYPHHRYPSLETQFLPRPRPAELPSPVADREERQSTPVRSGQEDQQGWHEEGNYQIRSQSSYPYQQSQLPRRDQKLYRHHPRLQELE
ncbi:hypothetical protein VTN96DRAFT_9168 [Rasamsonia emersonii]